MGLVLINGAYVFYGVIELRVMGFSRVNGGMGVMSLVGLMGLEGDDGWALCTINEFGGFMWAWLMGL